MNTNSSTSLPNYLNLKKPQEQSRQELMTKNPDVLKCLLEKSSDKLYVKSLGQQDRNIFIAILNKFLNGMFPSEEDIEQLGEIYKKNKKIYTTNNGNVPHSNILVRIKKFIQNTFFGRISSSKILDKAMLMKEERKGEFENPREQSSLTPKKEKIAAGEPSQGKNPTLINSDPGTPADNGDSNMRGDLELNISLQAELNQEIAVEKYDQYVLDLGSGNTVDGLKKDAIIKDLSTKIINLNNLNEFDIEKISFVNLTSLSRLYIVGHCEPGSDYIQSDNAEKLTAKDFAKMLALKLDKSSSSKQRIKIGLVASNAAVDKGEEKSFAYKLSEALAEKGIDAEVVFETHTVSSGNDTKYFSFDNEYHMNGSEKSFKTDPKTGLMTIKSATYSDGVLESHTDFGIETDLTIPLKQIPKQV